MATKQINNLQDIFLNNARKSKLTVNIRLLNGFQLKGLVTGFDSYTVVLESNGEQIMIYKHGILSITPQKPILYNSQLSDKE
ncbi:RNA-binding protein Hfq [Hathewaya proteolytica DSM 3090]|uniref:RNA-binding protein Hfq n=1 Tax=Hathewaya proteolytica DSM 3090 TaxID=1121331 RepID=A0A1M6J2X4_9CLOT|nr:RNA chaperone Hfq [Hathewaya proteolytica]SHJ41075.1 RNA-binding protein Hfq [Hathewaya proteolytica DSM 3090]